MARILRTDTRIALLVSVIVLAGVACSSVAHAAQDTAHLLQQLHDPDIQKQRDAAKALSNIQPVSSETLQTMITIVDVASPSPLAGKLFDENGEPLYVQGAAKGQRRYRYYVSRSLVRGEGKDAQRGWRLPANEIEHAIASAARGMLSDQAAITLALDESGNESASLASVLRSAAFQSERLESETECLSALAEIAERAELAHEGVRLSIKFPLVPKDEKGDRPPGQLVLTKLVLIRLKRPGIEMRMVIEGDVGRSRIDLPLLKAVARARRWSLDLIAGRTTSLGELARKEKVDGRSLRRLIQLGFLSPRIVEAMVEGRQPPEMSVVALTRRVKLAPRWSTQEQSLQIRQVRPFACHRRHVDRV